MRRRPAPSQACKRGNGDRPPHRWAPRSPKWVLTRLRSRRVRSRRRRRACTVGGECRRGGDDIVERQPPVQSRTEPRGSRARDDHRRPDGGTASRHGRPGLRGPLAARRRSAAGPVHGLAGEGGPPDHVGQDFAAPVASPRRGPGARLHAEPTSSVPPTSSIASASSAGRFRVPSSSIRPVKWPRPRFGLRGARRHRHTAPARRCRCRSVAPETSAVRWPGLDAGADSRPASEPRGIDRGQAGNQVRRHWCEPASEAVWIARPLVKHPRRDLALTRGQGHRGSPDRHGFGRGCFAAASDQPTVRLASTR